MVSALRHNFGYKLLAVVLACFLHFYAAGLINAHPSHVLILPLTVRNLPPTLILDENSVPSVTLTLDGPSEEINHLTDATITASVDLSHANAGQTPPLPVHLNGIPADVTLETEPSPVSLTLQPRRRRQLPISAENIGIAPPNFALTPPTLSPREAVITGTEESVNSVARLDAQADPDLAAGAVDDDFTIIALNAAGIPVSDVTVTPPTTHIRIGLVRALARKTLVVSPEVDGSPPAPYRFGSITVTPATVTAEGRTQDLAAIGTLKTVPIDLSAATGDIVRRVQPVVPTGITLSPSTPITVTIHIIPPPVPSPEQLTTHTPTSSP